MGLIYIAVPKTLADATAVVALHLANKDPAISIHIKTAEKFLHSKARPGTSYM